MGKKKMEEVENVNIPQFDLGEEIPMVAVPKETAEKETIQEKNYTSQRKEKTLISCLRNERIVVRYILKQSGLVTNPKHVLYGGMAETASKTFVVPKLSSGNYVNVLTDDEKDFLEEMMGLEPNSLSIYKKANNFWDDSNDMGISKVRLTKQDTYLNLSNPEDYIKYKILLANKNFICPSLQELQDRPKATYQFVMISEGDENKQAKVKMSTTQACYKEFGKIEDNKEVLRLIIETMDGRPTSANSKLEFLQTKINDLIQANGKTFLKVVQDPLLNTKVFIRECVDKGVIYKRGDFYYLRSDNTPLCEVGEDPTFNIAAKYLNAPRHQDLKFALEAKLKL